MNRPLNHPLDKPLHYPLNHPSPIRSFCLAVRGSAGIGLLVLSLAACAQSRGGASESPGSSGDDSAARSESVPGSDAKRSLDRSAPAPAAMSAAGDTDAEGGAAPDAAYSDIAPSEPPVTAPAQSKGQLAAGILTAGSFSDVLNFAAYRAFAEKFLATSEARRAVVDDQYWRLLGRAPSASESTTWVTTLGSSAAGEQQLIASLAASATYFAWF